MADAPRDPAEGFPDDDAIVDGELLEDAPAPAGDTPPGTGPSDLDPDPQAGDVTFETLLSDLERVAVERDQYLDAARRAQADFENFKKQSQRRADDHVARQVSGLVERLLPVLDACDAAISHGATEVEPIAAALLGALEKEGLERIDPKGEPFDPAVADAVVHEPGEGGEHVVAEVMRAGYAWQGRVLRPAMVKVTD
jgi:molecular chaperone GrpE